MMKKLLAMLVIFCLIMGSISVYAENFEWTDDISYGETKVITVPRPEGEVDENWVYFTQLFHFTPEVDGTYRFLINYEEDAAAPYDISMGVAPFTMVDGEKQYCDSNGYLALENGCAFDAEVGKSYELMFQYNSDDGRYPEFTFYLESDDVEIPKTGDMPLLLSSGMLLLAALGAALLLTNRRKMH